MTLAIQDARRTVSLGRETHHFQVLRPQVRRASAAAAMLAALTVLAGCGGSSPPGTNVVNAAPVARAGADRSTGVQALVTVNASASTDGDGDALGYVWEFTSRPAGSAAKLKNVTTQPGQVAVDRDGVRSFEPNVRFTPDVAGTYILQVTVDDGFPDSSSTDTLTVTVAATNMANAGPDQDVTFVVAGTTVNLDGTGSNDPSGVPLTYDWEILSFEPSSGVPPAAPALLVGASTATPTFDVNALDQLGTYTIQLTVNNGTVTATDEVVVAVAKSFPAAGALLGGGLFASAGAALRRFWKRRNSKAGAQ